MNESVLQIIRDLQAGKSITGEAAETVFSAIMQGEATPAQIAAILMGLTIRGEEPDVVAGAAAPSWELADTFRFTVPL